MKKLLFLFLVLVCANSYAQEFRVGVIGGLNVNSPSDLESQKGFHAGVKGEFNFQEASKGLFIDFGTILSSKGWKTTAYYDNTSKESNQWKSIPYYLDIPVHLGYKFQAGKYASIFASVGPYLSFGLFGKNQIITEDAKGNSKTATNSKNVFRDHLMERFDWGLGAKVGVELARHFQVAVGYNWGLRNLKTSKNTMDIKNKTFQVSCAYMF